MSSKFVDSPMDGSDFVKTPAGYKGGSGAYDGYRDGAFGSYPRTGSPNGVPEKIIDGDPESPKPSGESDQF